MPHRKYEKLVHMLEEDEEYSLLAQQLHQQTRLLRSVLLSLPDDKKQIIANYVGLCAEMELRIMDIVCMRFP